MFKNDQTERNAKQHSVFRGWAWLVIVVVVGALGWVPFYLFGHDWRRPDTIVTWHSSQQISINGMWYTFDRLIAETPFEGERATVHDQPYCLIVVADDRATFGHIAGLIQYIVSYHSSDQAIMLKSKDDAVPLPSPIAANGSLSFCLGGERHHGYRRDTVSKLSLRDSDGVGTADIGPIVALQIDHQDLVADYVQHAGVLWQKNCIWYNEIPTGRQ